MESELKVLKIERNPETYNIHIVLNGGQYYIDGEVVKFSETYIFCPGSFEWFVDNSQGLWETKQPYIKIGQRLISLSEFLLGMIRLPMMQQA